MQVRVASLYEEDELHLGSSVSKVTEEDWREQGADQTIEALEHVPGVHVSDYFHGQTVPSFRGFSGSEQYNSYLLLLDGMPLNAYSSAAGTYGTPNFALGNLEEIEVIRGPGSSIHGADAFNGVVSLRSWESDRDTVELHLDGGSFGYRSGTLRLRETLGKRLVWTGVVSAAGVDGLGKPQSFHPGGGAERIDTEVTGEYDNLTTTQKLSFGDFELGLYHSRHRVADALGPGELVGVFPNGGHTDGDAEMSALRLTHRRQLVAWELESSAFQTRSQLLGHFGLGNVGSAPVTPRLAWDSDDERRGLRLHARRPSGNGRLRITLGTSFDWMKVDHLAIGPDSFEIPPVARNASRTVQGGLAQLEWHLAQDRFRVIVGARHDRYSDFGSHSSPRLSLIWHPTPGSAVKFLYGHAFRAPSINEQSDNGVVKGGGDELQPEVVDTYELSWTRRSPSWRFDLRAYHSDVEDRINIDGTLLPGFLLEYTNGASAESQGLESEVRWRRSHWEVKAALGWNEAVGQEANGTELSFAPYPDWVFDVVVRYRPTGTIRLAVHNLVQDGMAAIDPGNVLAPSYRLPGETPTLWRTDVHLAWVLPTSGPDLKWRFTVRDLLDRQDQRSPMLTQEGSVGTPGMRLITGLSVVF